MAYDLNLFNDYLTLKGLSKTYKKQLNYCFLNFNFYGGFNQRTIGDFILKEKGNSFIARSFIELLKKFLIQYRKELQLTEEEFKEIIQAEVPAISGRKKSRIIIPLIKEEIELLEKTLETEELKLMLLICYNGGLRLQELIRIKVNSFNWKEWGEENKEESKYIKEGEEYISMGEVIVLGKGNKEGTCFLPNWLIKRIGTYVKNSSFNIDSSLFKISGRSFEIHLRNAGIKSGLTKKGENGEYIQNTIVHPHRLRHSYAYNLHKKGKDIRIIQKALRHENISSSQRYVHVSKEDLKKQLQGIN